MRRLSPLWAPLVLLCALWGVHPGRSQTQQPVTHPNPHDNPHLGTDPGCAQCHAGQAKFQALTPMGQAMQVRGHNTTLDANPRLTFQSGRFSYVVETRNGQTLYKVSDGNETVSIPVVWTMGDKAQTWVLERNGRMVESLVSYYPVIHGLDITTGDEKLHPTTLEEAVGRPFSDEDAQACFSCHSSGGVLNHKLNLSEVQPGLTCEHCHTGSLVHMAAITHGDHSRMPKDLGSFSAEEMSTFCGQCHRTWETVVRSHWSGSSNVRFQPYRLANSRCFDGADPRIGCTACHNPHDNLSHDTAFYDTRCMACHAPAVVASAANTNHAKVCPVAKANCASCHMPKVPLPNGHLIFTDHMIRVVKAGEAYPD